MVPNFLDKTHARHTDTGVVDLEHFTTKISRWSKVCLQDSHIGFTSGTHGDKLFLAGGVESRWWRQHVWGHHFNWRDWQDDRLCNYTGVIPKWDGSSQFKSIPNLECPNLCFGESIACQACCSTLKHVNIHVYESMGRWGVLWRGLPLFLHPKIHQLLGRMISSYISSPSFLWIHWFIDFEIPKLSLFWGISPRNMSEYDQNSHDLECPGFQLDLFFGGLPSTTDLFRDSVWRLAGGILPSSSAFHALIIPMQCTAQHLGELHSWCTLQCRIDRWPIHRWFAC